MTSFLFRLFLFSIFVRLGLSSRFHSKTFKGTATIYNPDENVGSCGKQYHSGDDVIAISQIHYDRQQYCNTMIEISRKQDGKSRKTVRGIVGDKCPSCNETHIDLSPHLFNQLGNPDEGIFNVTWHFL